MVDSVGIENKNQNYYIMSTNNNDKETKFNSISGLAIIGILFFAIILSASIMGVFKGYEPYQQLIAAMLSVAATGVITALLLIFQRKQQEELNKEQREFEKERIQKTKVFEERLRIYQQFLRKLCDVVKDQEISPQEEIELQFQVSYIAMHTSKQSIYDISEQVKEIVVRIKNKDKNQNLLIDQLFEVADSFRDELYGKKEDEMQSDEQFDEEDYFDYRKETIANFSNIVETNLKEYEIVKLKERIRELKKMVLKNCEKQAIFKGSVLYHEFYTTIRDGKYVPSKDTIAIDLLFEANECIIRICTRRYDPERTKEIAIAIDGVFTPGNTDLTAPHWHVHSRLPQSTSNDEIVRVLNELLSKVKAYRDKKYPNK